MPRRHRGRRAIKDVIPFDFVATFGAASKQVQVADLSIVRNRSMRPVRVAVSAAVIGATQLPALVLSLYDTKEDIINVSRPVVLGSTSKTLSVSAPRGTDYGDYASDTSNVIGLNALGYYNGTLTVAGTLWMQFAPHKVPSRVALLSGPFPPTGV